MLGGGEPAAMQEQREFYRRCMEGKWRMQLSGPRYNGQAGCVVSKSR